MIIVDTLVVVVNAELHVRGCIEVSVEIAVRMGMDWFDDRLQFSQPFFDNVQVTVKTLAIFEGESDYSVRIQRKISVVVGD
jgi:hypothetical protein